MSANAYYVELRRQVEGLWPQDAFPLPDLSVLEQIWVRVAEVGVHDDRIGFASALLFDDVLEIGLPGIDALTLSLGDPAAGVEVALAIDLHPAFAGTIGPVNLSVNVNADLLRPVARVNAATEPVPRFEVIAGARLAVPIAGVVVSFDLSGSVTIASDYAISLPPVMIGPTGVVVEAQTLRLVLSDADAVAAGLTAAARGVFVDGATVYLPQGLSVAVPADVRVDDCLIGPAGLSGTFTGQWVPTLSADRRRFEGPGSGDVLGVPFALEDLALEFVDNIPVASRVDGKVMLPYLNEPVGVSIAIGRDGALSVSLRAAGAEGVTVSRDDLLELTLRSLALTADDTAGVVVSGALRPLLMASDGLEWPRLDVTDLAIDTHGRLRIKEAWLDLQELATLDLFGFHFELNRIGLGYQETDDKLWIDLTGSLHLMEQIPVGLGVEGFRLTWPRTLLEQLSIDGPPTLDEAIAIAGRIEVKFDGVHLFYGVPGAVEFEGLIRFIKDTQAVGFAGDMALRVPATGLAAEAGLMVGFNLAAPPYPFLYVYFGIELPAGIPLGQSGLALKGALGLFGLNVAPDKSPDQNWYYDWYKRGPIVGAHPTNKWKNERDALAVGIGLTITTVDGYVKGVRGLLVVAIPGPILIVEGRALIFNGLTPAEPPLRALAVIDGREKIIQFNVEAEATLIEEMLDAYGMLEAFFDVKDLTNWHLYLGQDEPRDRRIQANVLKFHDAFLFKADAYLMVDTIGARTLRSRMGVFVGFKPPIPDVGPVKVTLDAVLEGRGEVTVLPEQFSGDIDLSATIELEAFGFGLQVSASAGVLTEGPRPLTVDARVKVEAELPAPLDPFEETFEFRWQAPEPPEITPPLNTVTADSPFAKGGRALEINHRSAVSGAPAWRQAAEESPVSPLDARPILAFGHEMNDEAGVPEGADRQPAFARHPDGVAKTYDAGLMRFTPVLTTVRLYEHRKGAPWPSTLEGWTLVASSRRADVGGRVAALPGVWTADTDPQDPSQPTTRRLQLWTSNPLLHASATLGRGYARPFDITPGGRAAPGASLAGQILELQPDLMLCGRTKEQRVCVDFAAAVGTTIEAGTTWTHRALQIKPQNNRAAVRQGRPSSTRPPIPGRVCLVGAGRISIRFPEPIVRAWIRFCVPPELGGSVPATVVDTARSAWTAKELKDIADEAKAKWTTIDPGACRFDVPRQTDVDGDTWTVHAAEGFECLALFKTHDFAIAEVCYLTLAESRRAVRATAQCAVNSTSPEPQHVLRAGSYYRLDIETTVAGRRVGGSGLLIELYDAVLAALDLDDAGTYRQVAFFQTEGPPTTIASYVKWSNPAAHATRVFRRDDLSLRFLRPCLREMYARPHQLEVLIRSAQASLVHGYSTTWNKAGSASLLHEEQVWREHRGVVGLPTTAVEADDVLEARHGSARLDAHARYDLLVSGGAGGALLLADGFATLSSDTWQPDTAAWRAADGVLARQQDTRAEILAGSESWSDIDAAVEVRLPNARAAGVIVRASATVRPGAEPLWNACRVSLSERSPGSFLLRLDAVRRDPEATGALQAKELHSSTVTLPTGLWYRLRVSVVANRVRVWIFDDLIVEGSLYRIVRDWTSAGRRPGTLVWHEGAPAADVQQATERGDLRASTAGRAGLHASGAGPAFRGLQIRDAILHVASFTTSAFDGFRELVTSADGHEPTRVDGSVPSAASRQAVRDAAAALARAQWDWYRAQIDYRFESLAGGRESLEGAKLRLRDARAAHDATFRTLAEAAASGVLYRPVAPHVEQYLLRNSAGRAIGLWLRSPESLDVREPVGDASGSSTGEHVGRTTVTVMRGSTLDVEVFHDADSTQLLIFRTNGSAWPTGLCRVTLTYHRNHNDEGGSGDHQYDRPVERGGTGEIEAVEVTCMV